MKIDPTFSPARTVAHLPIKCVKHQHASNAAAETILPTLTCLTQHYAASIVGKNMHPTTSIATAGDTFWDSTLSQMQWKRQRNQAETQEKRWQLSPNQFPPKR